MTKKEYLKPTMNVVKIQQENIICGTTQGLNNQLQSGSTVTSAWGRGGSAWDDDED